MRLAIAVQLALASTILFLPLATNGDGYTIVKITTRGRGATLSTHVHVARDPVTNRPRVVGIWRR